VPDTRGRYSREDLVVRNFARSPKQNGVRDEVRELKTTSTFLDEPHGEFLFGFL
jgi:hypothetical protein